MKVPARICVQIVVWTVFGRVTKVGTWLTVWSYFRGFWWGGWEPDMVSRFMFPL